MPARWRSSALAKTLLFDFGGVLTTPIRASYEAFAAAEGLDAKALWRVMRDVARTADDPFTLVETGAIDQSEFDVRLAALFNERLGSSIAPENLKVRLFSKVGPDEAMIGAIRTARSHGVPTGLISNSWGSDPGAGAYAGYGIEELFDVTVISGEVGLRKPEPEIYLLACERIGSKPEECAFVDDFEVNAQGASAVGMLGIRHKTAEETIPQLEEFLERSLR